MPAVRELYARRLQRDRLLVEVGVGAGALCIASKGRFRQMGLHRRKNHGRGEPPVHRD
jgi:hypothetical protein